MTEDDILADTTQVEGAPHPRDCPRVLGHAAAEAEFLAAHAAGRLHSGWLLTGPQGVGKASLAYRIATFLLAMPPPGDVGLFGAPPMPASLDISPDHPDAKLVRAGSHPRLFVVRRGPTEKGDRIPQDITVDVVRRLKGFFHLTAADGGRRVVIVDAADEMNTSAANAILKELEEPPPLTTLLLVAHQPSRLLPTIRSRCRVLRLAPLAPVDLAQALVAMDMTPDAAESLSVLADGSVGAAVRVMQGDGMAIYAALVTIFSAARMDRPGAIRLAEACTGRGAEARFSLTLDLIDLFLARLARAGLTGEPAVQAAPGEARLLARLSPDAAAARRWADLQQRLQARARHGRAVNLDPAALILDTCLAIDAAARAGAPA